MRETDDTIERGRSAPPASERLDRDRNRDVVDREREREREYERDHDHKRKHDRTVISPSTPDDPLGDELGRLDLATTDEGYVEAVITDLESVDETTISLTVRLPHDQLVAFDLEKPIPWSRDFLFARLVEDVGYDAASADHLVGERVYLKRTDLSEEAPKPTWLESLRTAGGTMLSAVADDLISTPGPQWRLVDPRERQPEPTDSSERTVTIATTLVVGGVLLAALGSVIGATGGVPVTLGMLVAFILGLVLALVGLSVALRQNADL